MSCRPGTALVAAVVVVVAAILGLRAVRSTVVEHDGAAADALIGPKIRAWYRGLLLPFEEAAERMGWSADALTMAQLAVSVLAGAAFAARCFFLGGWLTILAGTLDIIDGGVARRSGSASARGAFLDSVVDRYAEFVTFVGLGYCFRDGWGLLVVALAAFGSQMVSYTRARAEGLGLAMSVGRAQRPERYVLLGCGAWLSSLADHLVCPWLGRQPHTLLQVALLALAAISLGTALQRARHASRLLAERGA